MFIAQLCNTFRLEWTNYSLVPNKAPILHIFRVSYILHISLIDTAHILHISLEYHSVSLYYYITEQYSTALYNHIDISNESHNMSCPFR